MDQNQSPKEKWTPKEIWQLAGLVVLILVFTVRKGPVIVTVKKLFLYSLYGLGTTLIFVGLIKKMFKRTYTIKQLIKWSVILAAFFAVSQFIHEAFLTITGQMPK